MSYIYDISSLRVKRT